MTLLFCPEPTRKVKLVRVKYQVTRLSTPQPWLHAVDEWTCASRADSSHAFSTVINHYKCFERGAVCHVLMVASMSLLQRDRFEDSRCRNMPGWELGDLFDWSPDNRGLAAARRTTGGRDGRCRWSGIVVAERHLQGKSDKRRAQACQSGPSTTSSDHQSNETGARSANNTTLQVCRRVQTPKDPKPS